MSMYKAAAGLIRNVCRAAWTSKPFRFPAFRISPQPCDASMESKLCWRLKEYSQLPNINAQCTTSESYALREEMKESQSTDSGIAVFGPRKAAARQGKAILSGKMPTIRYACDKMVPIIVKSFTSIEAWTSGYSKLDLLNRRR